MTKYIVVTDPADLVRDLARRPRDEPVPLDTETTGLHMYEGDRITCGSLWFGDESYVFGPDHAAVIIEACYRGLTVFHNANFDRAMIERCHGLEIDDRLVVDTLTIDWCLRESWPHALKEIAARLWGHDEKTEQKKLHETMAGMTLDEAYRARRAEVGRTEPAAVSKEWAREHAATHPKRSWADLTLEELAPYAAKDAELTWRLLCHHNSELEQLRGSPQDVRPALLREHAVDAFCLRLQRTGIRVNQDRARVFRDEAQRTADEIAAEPVFEGINLRSDRQVAELVYDTWEHTCERFTDTGARSVDKAALSILAWDPRVARLQEFKKAANALSKFYNPILEHVATDGRIHASFRSHGTETGRFSSAGPNMQQLPRTSTNRRVRPLFEPEPGMELVEFDLEQAELRIGAAIAGERTIIEALEAGVDLYQVLAERVGVTRQQAKMIALCAVPQTLALTADLRWVPVEDLVVGDALVGFDASPPAAGQHRKWRQSFVTGTARRVAACRRIVFENGDKLTVSAGHPMLMTPLRTNAVHWHLARDIRPGWMVTRWMEPWEPYNDYRAGWLAGFFDGEGHQARLNGGMLGAAQAPGPVLDRARQYLNAFGFSYSVHESSSDVCHRIVLTGTNFDRWRFLGQIRPVRLLSNLRWGDGTRGGQRVRVDAVEDIGEQEVVALSTSTETYLTDGYASHNSAQYGIGAKKLAAQLAFGSGHRPDPRSARAILDAYWHGYPNLKRAIDDHARTWERQGYLDIGWPGRIRHLEGPFGPEPTYAGFNSVVQGGQAEFLKDVLLDLEEATSAFGRIVLTVHDSIVLETEPGYGDKVAALLEDISAERNRWGVPLRWACKAWEQAPCWLAAPGAPSWLCRLPFGHEGECDHVPLLEA